MKDEQKMKAAAKKAAASLNYKASLKKAVRGGDFEGVVKNIMLLAIKNNDDTDWKCSPRTFMELLQVLNNYRKEFGSTDQYDDILKVLEGGRDE
jgi:transcription initiation factor TFIIIB Brf1 subunit/transcription initiation factor TFIIB